MAQLKVLGGKGHTTTTWDPAKVETGNPEALAAVREAEKIVHEAQARGAALFEINPQTKKGAKVDKFDPQAEETLVVLPIAGG